MKRSLPHVAPDLDGLRRDGLYRTLRPSRASGSRITVGDADMINLGSNDYLAIPFRSGIGPHAASSRLVSGNDRSYGALEEDLAAHRSCESSLVYSTGYMAVLGSIPVLAVSGYTILSDELNHSSIIEACRLAGAETVVYGHNDMADLESKMAGVRGSTLVVTEGIFSMDGDYSRIKEISDISSRYGAFVVLDDAHGDFVVGRDGRGTAEMAGVAGDVSLTISSLSKALGSFGGYVAGDREVVDLLVNRSRPLIYTSALPPGVLEDAHGRMRYDMEPRRRRLSGNVRRLASGLEQMGLCEGPQTHIIPVMMGDEHRAVAFSESLARGGVYARAIRYPTVPRNGARIRVSVTAALSNDDIDAVLGAFEAALRQDAAAYRS